MEAGRRQAKLAYAWRLKSSILHGAGHPRPLGLENVTFLEKVGGSSFVARSNEVWGSLSWASAVHPYRRSMAGGRMGGGGGFPLAQGLFFVKGTANPATPREPLRPNLSEKTETTLILGSSVQMPSIWTRGFCCCGLFHGELAHILHVHFIKQHCSMGSSREDRAPVQGPKPAPLKMKKDSGGMIRKPPVPPPTQRRSPLIIYIKSPKIIHTKARDFMALVQRLTGKSPTTPPPSSSTSPSPSPPPRPSSFAPPIAAMPQAAPTSACFGASLALDGTSTNLGISQEIPLNIDPFFGEDVVIDAKPYQMLPPREMLSAMPSNLQFSPSPKPYPKLLEISTPTIFGSPNSLEMNPFLSVQRPVPLNLINQTSASSGFDTDFTTRSGLHSW
ncbi:VQ motif-containing protein 8 [Nymphaea thermarum]|nr:VQ motif-containing protein 8 [Nymphaea thermarum]